MHVFDPLSQGLECLSQRELQRAEHLFLRVINDPYSQTEEQSLARKYLHDIRSCQAGDKNLDFDSYKTIVKKPEVSFDPVNELLAAVYFSPAASYAEIEQALAAKIQAVISRLKLVKIGDLTERDDLFAAMEKGGAAFIREKVEARGGSSEQGHPAFDEYRWRTIFRKFTAQVNPVLLERHLELLEYILETGNIGILDDPKLATLTPKSRWVIESTLNMRWYLLRSYFFKARVEIKSQFGKRDGTRKYWEEMKQRKIEIFEKCGFHERHIQKFLYTDKLNCRSLEDIYRFARGLGMTLEPRDVSLALRGVAKAKDHIRERHGDLLGGRKEFQEQLLSLGFTAENAYRAARHARQGYNRQIAESVRKALDIAAAEIYWYRVPPQSEPLRRDLQAQCARHLSTVRIHLFDRGRLNKIMLRIGKSLIRRYLVKLYGEDVLSLHCYFRLATAHQYYKLKFFEYHAASVPTVSDLIKINRAEFKPILLEGYAAFLKKKRLTVPPAVYGEIAAHRSATEWEDEHTTPEEKILLKYWFLADHGVQLTQGLINKGVLSPSVSLWSFLNRQEGECNS